MRALLTFLIFNCALAQADAFIGPLATSLGGTGRAGLLGPESVFLNPALVPLLQTTEMVGYFKDGDAGPAQHRYAWGVGAVDASKEAYFPATLHYLRTRETGRTATPVNGEIWHSALGKNISDRAAIGISGYRLTQKVEGDREYTQWNFALGALVMVHENMGVAYVLNNIAGPGSEVPQGLREDMNQGLGFYGSIAEMARLRVDVTRNERFNPDHKMTYMIGVESMVNDYILFRMGFRRDELADQRIYAAGLGFNGPRLKIDYAVEKNVKGTSGAVHSVDMRIPF